MNKELETQLLELNVYVHLLLFFDNLTLLKET